jgi:hypothetical protein
MLTTTQFWLIPLESRRCSGGFAVPPTDILLSSTWVDRFHSNGWFCHWIWITFPTHSPHILHTLYILWWTAHSQSGSEDTFDAGIFSLAALATVDAGLFSLTALATVDAGLFFFFQMIEVELFIIFYKPQTAKNVYTCGDTFTVLKAIGYSCLYWIEDWNVVLEAGLFESKIRILYACVHLGRFTKEISSSH